MSAYQNVSPDGTTVTLGLNGNPAITYTSSGAQFTKNKLINGEVTRINQRAFNGTWSGKSVWETQAATIAAKELAYGYDMWFRSNAARSDGTGANENMGTWIESGNFRPSTVHTLSGNLVTTTQITSPASGDWKIVVAQGATNVQVEEGNVATPFEIRPIRYELAECQRYYWQTTGSAGASGFASIGTGYASGTSAANVVIPLPVPMRTNPILGFGGIVTVYSVLTSSPLTGFTTTFVGNCLVWASVACSGAGLSANYSVVMYTQNAATNYFYASAVI